jgi:hypothetical protein
MPCLPILRERHIETLKRVVEHNVHWGSAHIIIWHGQVPAAQQLVDGAVHVLQCTPGAVFPLADLLTAASKGNDGKDRQLIMARLVELAQQCNHLEDPSALLAPVHLLAVLTSESAPAKQAAAKSGMYTFSAGL